MSDVRGMIERAEMRAQDCLRSADGAEQTAKDCGPESSLAGHMYLTADAYIIRAAKIRETIALIGAIGCDNFPKLPTEEQRLLIAGLFADQK